MEFECRHEAERAYYGLPVLVLWRVIERERAYRVLAVSLISLGQYRYRAPVTKGEAPREGGQAIRIFSKTSMIICYHRYREGSY